MAADRDPEHLNADVEAKQVKGSDSRDQGESLAARIKGDRAAFVTMLGQLPRHAHAPLIAAAQRMYGNRFVTQALSSTPDYSGMDVEDVAQLVMAECAEDAAADTRQVLEDMAAQNKDKQALRDHATGGKQSRTEDDSSKSPRRRKP
jgi:hypothetical protein